MADTVCEWASVCVKLLQGAVYEDSDPSAWRNLLAWQVKIADYFAQIGLSLYLDSGEGYAFLKQTADDVEESDDEHTTIPRLIRRIPLSYEMSLLCVILREALEQYDASQSRSRALYMKDSEIKQLISVYIKEQTDQAKLYRELDRYLKQAVELTFLKEVKLEGELSARAAENSSDSRGAERLFEVRRILRAKIDVNFLEDFKKRLEDIHGGTS